MSQASSPCSKTVLIVELVLAAILPSLHLLRVHASAALQEVSLSQALELEKQKDFAGAERLYKEALRQAADDPEILKRLGIVCQQQGKHACQ